VSHPVTQILDRLQAGDRLAAGELLPAVYDELRKLAAMRLAQEQPGQTLQATALVHEAYLRLIGDDDQPIWENRRHFFGAAAEAMRRILVESARRRRTLKRGGDHGEIPLEEALIVIEDSQLDVIDLDEVLQQLAQVDPAAGELVRLRYFAGLSQTEAAELMQIPLRTVERTWAYARAWLLRALQERDGSGENPQIVGG
jgi:RNA polymerase sigma factor (TIGR02999 family)